jgi:hypothetical protein
MEKVISKIKITRHNWWEAFKSFMSIKGYKYYVPPKEMKYRYPAPGSIPRNSHGKPNLYKNDWKTSYKESELNIRPVVKFQPDDEYYKAIYASEHKLDPNNKQHAELMLGPMTNLKRKEDKVTNTMDSFGFDQYTDREEVAKKFRRVYEQEHVARLYQFQENDRWGSPFTEDLYEPQFLLFYERGAMGCGDDPKIKHMFLELEYYFEEILGKERIETKQMDMYKGTVKKWQVLDPEAYSQDQIDKVQNAIKAPLADELDRFAEESDVKMPLPISNKNVGEWRDKKKATDNADFNSKLIEFERKRSENYFMKRYERPKQLE